jgi:transposase
MSRPLNAQSLEGLRGQPEALIGIILRQAALIEALRQEAEALRAEVARLQARVQELEGQGPPAAAPFRRPARQKSPSPRPPGRAAGHPGAFRAWPAACDETLEVPLGPHCPGCGQPLSELRRIEQTVVELPASPARTTRLVTWRAYCPHCRKEVRSAHPLQGSTATGAAGTQLGPRALGVACALKHQAGLSLAKTALVLRELGGLTVSPGGLAQAFQRVAARLAPEYEALRTGLLQSEVIHSDETSWWVGGPQASLWVFCNRQATFYRVVEHRDRASFYEVIPAEWPGVLVSDCLSVYDGATPLQHKCYAHHLKAVRAAEEAGAPAGPGDFGPLCRRLLHQAMALKAQEAAVRAAGDYEARRRGLDLAARALLGEPRADPAEEALRARLAKQLDHLFTFLDHPALEDATNNLAERQLRPAVIARKVSCGQRSWRGAQAWQVLASLAATCRQRGQSFIDLVAAKMTCPAR